MSKQKGVGLAEILISLFLASLIMTALMSHYIKTKQHYIQLQAAIDDDAEKLLVADFMRDSIRQAGFTPCIGIEHLISFDHRYGEKNFKSFEIHDQALVIHRMNPSFDSVVTQSKITEIVATNTQKFHIERPILIADCMHAEVQNITSVIQTSSNQVITIAHPLLFEYVPPIYIGEWLEEQFFVRASRGLFYRSHHTDELTDQIKNMSVKRLPHANGTVLSVVLNSDNGHPLLLETKVRSQ